MFCSTKPLTLKANKNGVIVIRQTPSTNTVSNKKMKPPSAESTRSIRRSNSIRRTSKVENGKQKQQHSKTSKSPTKLDKLSKAKSFHELSDLTPPRSPILPTRYGNTLSMCV